MLEREMYFHRETCPRRNLCKTKNCKKKTGKISVPCPSFLFTCMKYPRLSAIAMRTILSLRFTLILMTRLAAAAQKLEIRKSGIKQWPPLTVRNKQLLPQFNAISAFLLVHTDCAKRKIRYESLLLLLSGRYYQIVT